jgi:phosphate transport system protein
MVRSYEQELKQLRAMLVDMGGLLENQLLMATTAVVQHDSDAATAAMEQDPAVDRLERDIEAFVIRMLALRQPAITPPMSPSAVSS